MSDPNPDVGGQPTIDEVITAYNVTRLSTIASRLPQRLHLLFLHRHAHQTLMSLMKMKMRLALQATVSPSPPHPLCQLHECRPISLYESALLSEHQYQPCRRSYSMLSAAPCRARTRVPGRSISVRTFGTVLVRVPKVTSTSYTVVYCLPPVS